ncbi:hypothetical protein PF005_g13956 [Phytophthora fragariae]|uniref:Pectate lyase n=1 Tax=Phytophthora fragariae TaxID=53985 RepID=A0A6A3LAP6_9STRA|nr:hypothetical protein PF003_g26108 [Phytophthora fragariae]KAE8941201.1 hypothetical protein PF009_g8998 [Phytophthora fragariae]KAE9016481.1 hypothetical protein PF011_g7138 [Phytophthora fragariae]KAE9105054.1 hypothetical protein PF007_g13838 [Phytophthora fragariae]KAE9141440.1 hypothetical protein PF006_g13195 [Phytophthora fragariae]
MQTCQRPRVVGVLCMLLSLTCLRGTVVKARANQSNHKQVDTPYRYEVACDSRCAA